MGVNEQFYTRHRRGQEFRGRGFRDFLKGAAKKGWQFVKNEGKKAGSKLIEAGTDYVKTELSDAGKAYLDKTGAKIRDGVRDIVKESAGPLAEGILKNPNATRELLQDSFDTASNKSKKLYSDIRNDTQNFVTGNANNMKVHAGVALSDALASSKLGKKMKGKGNVDGELTKPKGKAPQRKRLTTIVPVSMPMHSGQGANYIGQQYAHRGNGARVIGGQH